MDSLVGTYLVGTWVPFASQATYGETPLRSIKSNGFSTLVIQPGGVGYGVRERLFGTNKVNLEWEDGLLSHFRIHLDDGLMTLICSFSKNELGKLDILETMIHTEQNILGVNGMGMYFRRA